HFITDRVRTTNEDKHRGEKGDDVDAGGVSSPLGSASKDVRGWLRREVARLDLCRPAVALGLLDRTEQGACELLVVFDFRHRGNELLARDGERARKIVGVLDHVGADLGALVFVVLRGNESFQVFQWLRHAALLGGVGQNARTPPRRAPGGMWLCEWMKRACARARATGEGEGVESFSRRRPSPVHPDDRPFASSRERRALARLER